MLSVKYYLCVCGSSFDIDEPMALAEMGLLTYMSIEEWIAGQIQYGNLFELRPISGRVIRELFVSKEIHDLVKGPWDSQEAEKRCAPLLAELENFVTGGVIAICIEPFKAAKSKAFMGILDPTRDGVWDIRSMKPKPGLRLLGLFSKKNTFLAFIPAARSTKCNFVSRGPLGGADSKEWADAIHDTKQLWMRHMLPWKPVNGDNPDAYLTNYNCS